MATMATRAMTSHRYTFEGALADGSGVDVGSGVGVAVGGINGLSVGAVEGLLMGTGMKEELSLRMTVPPSSPDGLGVGVAVGLGVGVGVGVARGMARSFGTSTSLFDLGTQKLLVRLHPL